MKKKVLFVGLIALGLISCDQGNDKGTSVDTEIVDNPSTAATENVDAENLPAFEFEEEVFEFGEISQGEKVKHRFKFTNVGESDLIISDAKGSCGCTVPLWPKEPIRPGEEGEVEVVFDSNGKQGRQHKTVTLISNTIPNTKVIAIKGDVLVPTKQ